MNHKKRKQALEKIKYLRKGVKGAREAMLRRTTSPFCGHMAERVIELLDEVDGRRHEARRFQRISGVDLAAHTR